MTVTLSWTPPDPAPADHPYFEIRRDDAMQDLVVDSTWSEGWWGTPPEPGKSYTYVVRTVVWEDGERMASQPSEPVRVRMPDWGLDAAALAGRFRISREVASSSDEWESGALNDDDNWTWVFYPACSSGPCPVAASMRLSPGWLHLTLRSLPAPRSWIGEAEDSPSWTCTTDGSSPKIRVALQTEGGAWEAERWLVGSLGGTMDIRFPRTSACRYAWLTYDLKGDLVEPPSSGPSSL
jgi:hypothetical protein